LSIFQTSEAQILNDSLEYLIRPHYASAVEITETFKISITGIIISIKYRMINSNCLSPGLDRNGLEVMNHYFYETYAGKELFLI
jgi:hypothetical protein